MGGIGSCGRELCCSTWLTDFKSVNTTAARYQNLSINQTKLSGQCGRLKCCLNFELDTYLDALQQFPDNAEYIEFAKGRAMLVKKDIFKNLMWYVLEGGNKHYPLTILRVKEIIRMNAQGIKPEEIEPVDVTTGKPKEVELQFVDVVGQISLKSLERNDKRRREQRNQPPPQQRRPDFRQPDNRNTRPSNPENRPHQDNRNNGPRNPNNRNRPPFDRGNQQQRPQQPNQPQKPPFKKD